MPVLTSCPTRRDRACALTRTPRVPGLGGCVLCVFFSSRSRHTRCLSDWSSDVCSSDLLRDHSRYELAATALHEGYPGHHLHLVTAKGLPSHVRKNLWTPLTVEGWALYCEDIDRKSVV